LALLFPENESDKLTPLAGETISKKTKYWKYVVLSAKEIIYTHELRTFAIYIITEKYIQRF